MTDPETDRMLGDARVAEAVEERRERHARRRQRGAASHMAALLADLAEAGGTTLVRTVGGGVHRGAVLAVGADHAVLATEHGDAYVRLARVAELRPPEGRRPAATGSGRDVSGQPGLDAVLRAAVDDRPEVTLTVRGRATPCRAELVAVGDDVLTAHLADGGALVHIALDAIDDVLLPAGEGPRRRAAARHDEITER